MPHPALSPVPEDTRPFTLHEQAENERIYRQLLVQGTLAVLLPTEDLQNDPLRILVGDIVADLIIGQALASKLCHGWFLHDAITKATSVLSDKVQTNANNVELHDEAKSRLEQFGLLTSDSKFQSDHSPAFKQSKFVSRFWRCMQFLFLVYLFLRYLLKELNSLYRHPMRNRRGPGLVEPMEFVDKSQSQISTSRLSMPPPVIAFGIFSTISTLLKLVDRMPWLTGIFIFWQNLFLNGYGQVGVVSSLLDRYVNTFHCMSFASNSGLLRSREDTPRIPESQNHLDYLPYYG